jgi:hypothetical protein
MKTKKICDNKMTFEECELAILRTSIDLAQEKIAKRIVSSPSIQAMTAIVADFIKRKGLIPYGGIAINNILPKDEQFYDEETEIPDYDFFSPNAMDDAKELADIYHKKGFEQVEAKAGQHFGTYKVFVQFIPVADITYIPKPLFNSLKKHAIRVNGILYTPPNFLRMSMYLELSRPAGDTDRWEKVYKRLRLLNKHYPMKNPKCNDIDFQRPMEASPDEAEEIFNITRDTLINQSVVFFGGYAIALYSKYMPTKLQKKLKQVPDFDVLSTDPKTTAEILKERLLESDIQDVKIVYHKPIGEVIPENYEVKIGKKDTIAYIYATIGCHSYNTIDDGDKEIKIASIDTMLSFYLAFLYGYGDAFSEKYSDRILCMAQFLFDVQEKNRLSQKGLLRRFSITCYGHQESLEEMRAHKADKMKELKDQRGSRIYDEHFLVYRPGEVKKTLIKFKGKSKSKSKTKSGNSTSSSSSSGTSSGTSSDDSHHIRRRKSNTNYKKQTRNNKNLRRKPQRVLKRATKKNNKRR